ncbi:hypothetical protein [Microcoleus sp. AR_TQ3_B6]|uniref:hypothetical protein n=1 Tax=Microcoleus sp. AR_TQ3_B6 TaxID=3055284 RepID=UPI002FD42A65
MYQKIHILQQQADKFCSGAGIWAKISVRARSHLVGNSGKMPIDSRFGLKARSG